ncbi:hypothetical protein Marpi_0899 [Marinitoga piezophila KA3]|uniref:Fido domain-containing protein n=1 Tax=Marinitoga piezophila (strain DSM 14283 / JCM 11233 / KA3) TaxID=443254 RepID=H2J7C3_MARPK|nr:MULTISPECIES: Fic family protein [Marinitoga]AEX85315.1 hypothetical protein Marpi_0899 [Marinitoga piezophila KA3]APT75800.1 hypothetical protein LN42_04940 [Marinitoga sp. 1137]NUU97466.1 hypothetical protein [Marinitoga sp. 1138]
MAKDNLIEFRKKLFSLQVIKIPNNEWLYMLGSETRNSIMIEGIFVDEDELDSAISGKYKSGSEVSNYFRTARYYYNMAIELSRTNEEIPCLTFVKNTHRMLFENIIKNYDKLGNFRNGPIKITGAKINPPMYDIADWIRLWCNYSKYAFSNHPIAEASARVHVFFESIHPFEDGNGRIGRILLNFLLIANGYLNIVLKGEKEKDRNNYILALESAEKGIREIFKSSPTSFTPEQIDNHFKKEDTKKLSKIIRDAIIETYDKLICSENKEKLVTVEEYSNLSGKTQENIRKMISRKKLIAWKPRGRWLIYPFQIKNN